MPNTLDVLKINNSEELIGLVEDAVKVSHEVSFFEASPVIRNSYKTLCLTADPVVGFRAAGAQRTYNAPTPADVGGIPIYVTDAIINNEESFED